MLFKENSESKSEMTPEFVNAMLLYNNLRYDESFLKRDLAQYMKNNSIESLNEVEQQIVIKDFKDNYIRSVKNDYFTLLAKEMKSLYTESYVKQLKSSKYISLAEACLCRIEMNPTDLDNKDLSDLFSYEFITNEKTLFHEMAQELCMAINGGHIPAFDEHARLISSIDLSKAVKFKSIKVQTKEFLSFFDDLKHSNKKEKELGVKERTTLLNLIAALYEILLETPRTYQGCVYQKADIIRKIESKYPNTQGLKSRNLHEKLKEATDFLNELNIE